MRTPLSPLASVSRLPENVLWYVAVLLVGMLFGATSLLPNIWQRFEPSYPFQGIEIMGTDQEDFYATRIREVQDGFWFLGNVYHAEGKDLPNVQPPLAEWVMDGMGLLLGLDAARTVLLMKFLFGILLTASMTCFCTRVTRRPWWSLMAVSAVLFAWFLFASPSVFWGTITGSLPGTGFLRFSRPSHPLFSSTLFFSALWTLLVWLDTRKRSFLLLSGILTGASFYDYPFTWTYIGIIVLCTGLRALIRREGWILRGICMFSLIVAFIALPYVVHQFLLLEHPFYDDFARRVGMVYTREPLFGGWILFLLLLSLMFWERGGKYGWFVTSIAISGIVVLNQQVITGVSVMPHHYHWYYTHPLAVLFTILIVGPWVFERFVPHLSLGGRRCGFLFLLFILLALGVDFQRDSYREVRQMWGENQHMAGVLSFLTEHGNSKNVVYAPSIQQLIPVYTPLNVYNAANASTCLCSDDEQRDRYFFELWLNGVTPQEASHSLPTTRRFELSSRLHSIYYREAAGGYDRIPDAEVDKAIRAYREYYARSIEEKLALYPVHFFAFPQEQWNTYSGPLQTVQERSTLVYRDDYYEVWELSST